MNRRKLLTGLAAAGMLAIATTTRLGETVLKVVPSTVVSREVSYNPGQNHDGSEVLQNYTQVYSIYTEPDGSEWHDLVRKSGGDYRNNARAMEIFERTGDMVYQRHLDRKAGLRVWPPMSVA